uniref:Uncharacterized protein n=1 Tax=viral metagenome TaxID=1070528 RepID=A0A6C0E1W6_9ZZZZ
MFGTYGLCLKLFYNFKYKHHNEIKKKSVLKRPKIIFYNNNNDIVKKKFKLFTIDENLEY